MSVDYCTLILIYKLMVTKHRSCRSYPVVVCGMSERVDVSLCLEAKIDIEIEKGSIKQSLLIV